MSSHRILAQTMVDYSKWDKFCKDIDSESDDGNLEPSVSKLSGDGGKVTIGPKGYQIHEGSDAVHKEQEERDDEDDFDKDDYQEAMKRQKLMEEEDKTRQSDTSSTHKASTVPTKLQTPDVFHRKYRNIEYLWSQDRYEVTVILFLPIISESALAKKDLLLSYANLTKTIRLTRRSPLEGSGSSANSPISLLFEGILQYEIEVTGDPSNPFDDILEWNIRHNLHPLTQIQEISVEIVLKKKSPFVGVTIWWSHVFAGETEKVDVSKLKGRDTRRIQEVEDSFQSAQRQFLEKMEKDRTEKVDRRVEIDLRDQDEEDEEAQGAGLRVTERENDK